jgi:hypothetical protein
MKVGETQVMDSADFQKHNRIYFQVAYDKAATICSTA